MQKKKSILAIIYYPFLPATTGGEISTLNILKYLSLKHDVTVFTVEPYSPGFDLNGAKFQLFQTNTSHKVACAAFCTIQNITSCFTCWERLYTLQKLPSSYKPRSQSGHSTMLLKKPQKLLLRPIVTCQVQEKQDVMHNVQVNLSSNGLSENCRSPVNWPFSRYWS